MAELTPIQRCQVEAVRRYLGGRALVNERTVHGRTVWDVAGMEGVVTVDTSVRSGVGAGGGDLTSTSIIYATPRNPQDPDDLGASRALTVHHDSTRQYTQHEESTLRRLPGGNFAGSSMDLPPDRRFDQEVSQCVGIASLSPM